MELSERGLLKISLIGTVMGLIALYFVTQGLVPEHKKISEIKIGSIGSEVSVNGTIKDVKRSGGNVIFTLEDGNESIKIVLWKNVLDRLRLERFDLEKLINGNKIEVVGTVEGYKGELEIIGKGVIWRPEKSS